MKKERLKTLTEDGRRRDDWMPHTLYVRRDASVCLCNVCVIFCLELGGSLDSAHPIATPLPIGDEMKD